MRRIETVAEIGPDRQVTVQLPPDLPEGPHRVIVLVDEAPPAGVAESEVVPDAEDCLVWENGLLVYTGQLLDDPIKVLDDIRAERERRFLSGYTDESPL